MTTVAAADGLVVTVTRPPAGMSTSLGDYLELQCAVRTDLAEGLKDASEHVFCDVEV